METFDTLPMASEYQEKIAAEKLKSHGWSEKLSVTTQCPGCNKEWEQEIQVGLPCFYVFEMCNSCMKLNSNETGNDEAQNEHRQ